MNRRNSAGLCCGLDASLGTIHGERDISSILRGAALGQSCFRSFESGAGALQIDFAGSFASVCQNNDAARKHFDKTSKHCEILNIATRAVRKRAHAKFAQQRRMAGQMPM